MKGHVVLMLFGEVNIHRVIDAQFRRRLHMFRDKNIACLSETDITQVKSFIEVGQQEQAIVIVLALTITSLAPWLDV